MPELPSHTYYPERQLFHGFVPLVMGTKLEALLFCVSEPAAGAIWEQMCAEAFRLNALLDRFDPTSEISRLNAGSDGGELRPAPELLPLLRESESYRERTGGLFDITRGSCGEGLQLTPDGALFLHGGTLDFGGFAKGWFLRWCRNTLAAAGLTTAYVDFGGSAILALGRHPFGECWRIRVAHPYSGAVLQDVDLVDRSLSTSGNRPGYSGHIVDPRSGRPVTAQRLTTVVSPDPLEAEVLSTAAMVSSEEELGFLRNNFQLSTINRYDV